MRFRETINYKALASLLAIAWLLLGVFPAHAGTPTMKTTVRLIVTNAQGTVVATMTPQGQVTYTAAYRPYGKQAEGTPQPGPGYTGHVNDPDTGLVYMQQRYYDPGIGFISPDPVMPTPGNIYNFNRYAYANNNPVMNIDPTGAYTCDDNSDVKGNHYCKDIAKGYERLVQASHNPRMSAPVHAILVKLVKKLGKPGDASTGVTIFTSGHTVAGTEVTGGTKVQQTPSGNSTTNIGLQMQTFSSRFSWQSESDFISHLGGLITHEGTHMLGQLANGMPRTGLEEYGDEFRAYTIEAYYQKAVGYSGFPGLWNPYSGISVKGIMNGAAQSTTSWCRGPGAVCSTTLLNRIK